MRRGTILAVDDEPALLRMFKQYLDRFGYEVDICSSAEQALALFTGHPGRYQLVLADLTMPGMTGEELVKRLLPLDPAVCMLICSGYPFDLTDFPEPLRRRIRFLQKPFLPNVLLNAVDELLVDASDRDVSA